MPMARWEYLILVPYDWGGQVRAWKVNGVELLDWKRGPSLHEYGT